MFDKLTSLLITSSLVILPIGLTILDTNPALASKQTDKTWKQYFSGTKVVYMSSYSSDYGRGGGFSSKKEIHFCSNGEFAYNSNSSMTVNAGASSAASASSGDSTGTWKIVESTQNRVILEITDRSGGTANVVFGIGKDGKLYDGANTRWFHVDTDACN